MRYLGLDPGLRTGMATLISYSDEPFIQDWNGVIENGVDGFIRWWNANYDFMAFRTDLVVCERFIPDGTVTGTWAPQIEGALKVLAERDNVPVIFQDRGDKAALLPGEPARRKWLRERGFAFDATHDMDALTHLIVYVKRQKHLPSIREWWPETS